jgi:hypothetical protein
MAKGLKNVMHHENIPVLDQITCYLRPSPAFHSCKLGARFFDVMINMVDGLNHDDVLLKVCSITDSFLTKRQNRSIKIGFGAAVDTQSLF